MDDHFTALDITSSMRNGAFCEKRYWTDLYPANLPFFKTLISSEEAKQETHAVYSKD